MNTNPLLQNSILGSKWLNPDYLFQRFLESLYKIFNYRVGAETLYIYNIVLVCLSIFFFIMVCYTIIRLLEIRAKEHKHLDHEIEEYAHHQAEKAEKAKKGNAISKNDRWVKTLAYLFSQHSSDWKLAVIEADSMLESLMDQLGFKGEGLGDKLKSATQEKFHSLTSAWEVHTIRNKIAHEGTAFQLSQHEAKRVLALYESIFREFGFI